MSSPTTLRPCKVIIVGSSLAGLALALMLEKAGIDYILLEAYDEIVANVSAGIVMLPNGLRILDHFGCYEALPGPVDEAIKVMSFREPEGEVLAETNPPEGIRADNGRYGYPAIWLERSAVLEVIYDRTSDKSRLLAQKRVDSMRHLDDAVEVKCTVTYGCLFGVSPTVPGIPAGYLGFGVNQHFSHLVGTGPANKTYWALMSNLGRTLRGAEIPVQDHWNDKITPSIIFGDLYKCRERKTYAPMREGVNKKWHLDRMMTIGDACHQVDDGRGWAGGNQALESAAALTNSLFDMLSMPSAERLATDEIRAMFQEVQELRSPRVTFAMKMSRTRQELDAMETPELEDVMLNKFRHVPGAVSLQMLEVPVRARTVPFDDEKGGERVRLNSQL
ncbi:hypothetical protein BJX70DRAFT_391677 [Aspergillus crustosus]